MFSVTIYGASWCSACKQAIKFCEDRGIDFTYIDIEESQDPQVKNFRSLPQIYSGAQNIGGLKKLRESYEKFS